MKKTQTGECAEKTEKNNSPKKKKERKDRRVKNSHRITHRIKKEKTVYIEKDRKVSNKNERKKRTGLEKNCTQIKQQQYQYQ